MLEKGYQHGQGLGKTTKGIAEVLRLGENKDKFGLGYRPHQQIEKGWLKRKKKEVGSTRESRACYMRNSHLRHLPKFQERWIHV
ncbi:G-patch domain [Sesbania bispinosa]|nr:G-patch domain [Sesbania bispinosa]